MARADGSLAYLSQDGCLTNEVDSRGTVTAHACMGGEDRVLERASDGEAFVRLARKPAAEPDGERHAFVQWVSTRGGSILREWQAPESFDAFVTLTADLQHVVASGGSVLARDDGLVNDGAEVLLVLLEQHRHTVGVDGGLEGRAEDVVHVGLVVGAVAGDEVVLGGFVERLAERERDGLVGGDDAVDVGEEVLLRAGQVGLEPRDGRVRRLAQPCEILEHDRTPEVPHGPTGMVGSGSSRFLFPKIVGNCALGAPRLRRCDFG